ncbi:MULTISPECIES: hypothetical protein [Actinomycetes]|uniref:hypothetical protein n=1 Tax=Aeromicrobium tamlense TaxID=375541 RepID=UPI0031E21943
MSDESTTSAEQSHRLKKEEELVAEYEKLRSHLEVFWMYRPRNKALMSAFPGTVKELSRRVDFLEEILQIPQEERFDYEEVDQREIQ